MSRLLNRFRIIILDTLGVLLIIAAVLFGWLPGIGGIPLFIAGMGLLAINHAWARKSLKTAEQKGEEWLDALFIDGPLAKILYDLAALLVAGTTIYLVIIFDKNWQRSLALLGLAVASLLFLGNRKRLKHIKSYLKHKRILK